VAVALCCHFPTTQLQLLWLNYGSMTGWSVYVCACALVVITKEPIENRAPSNFLGSDIDTASHRGPFNDYVDKILHFFDHLPTSNWAILTLNVDKNRHFRLDSLTYPPHLVRVVIERPLTAAVT
jgi:hypothetical protein